MHFCTENCFILKQKKHIRQNIYENILWKFKNCVFTRRRDSGFTIFLSGEQVNDLMQS